MNKYYDARRVATLANIPRWPLTTQQMRELEPYFPQQQLNSTAGLHKMMMEITQQIAIERAVEVGSYRGVSTECLAMFCDQLYAVDPWAGEYDVYDVFIRNIERYKNVIPIRETSQEASFRFDNESLDFVYLDGMHTYEHVVADIKAWLPLVRPGGFLCGHDYVDYGDSWAKQWIQVPDAVRDTLGIIPQIYPDSSWLWRKLG